jgi:chloramphenicol-sensitive protein RarD
MFWGIIGVLFFREAAARGVVPLEIVGHRIIWSLAFVTIIVLVLRDTPGILAVIRSRSVLMRLALSAGLVSINWLVFIYAVSTHQLAQSSLGYFMNPLANVALGVLVLRERLRPAAKVAVALAAVAVVWLLVGQGSLPWIPLSLALSFAFYGLVRKTTNVGPIPGLCVETLVLLPVGLLIVGLGLVSGGSTRKAIEEPDWMLLTLFVASGAITAIPLLLFNAAARRLSMITLGFVQYIGPTCQFLLAAFVFREAIDTPKLIAFALIWAGLVIYSVDTLRARRSPPSNDPAEAG